MIPWFSYSPVEFPSRIGTRQIYLVLDREVDIMTFLHLEHHFPFLPGVTLDPTLSSIVILVTSIGRGTRAYSQMHCYTSGSRPPRVN
jgi:hypothetical protein